MSLLPHKIRFHVAEYQTSCKQLIKQLQQFSMHCYLLTGLSIKDTESGRGQQYEQGIKSISVLFLFIDIKKR